MYGCSSLDASYEKLKLMHQILNILSTHISNELGKGLFAVRDSIFRPTQLQGGLVLQEIQGRHISLPACTAVYMMQANTKQQCMAALAEPAQAMALVSRRDIPG